MSEVAWKSLRRKAEDATRPPEPGWYVLECVKADLGKASTTGNPMIKCQFKIAEGPAAGKTVPNNFNITVDNDIAMSIFFRHMAALGLAERFFDAEPTLAQVADSLVGRRANVQLGVRVWNGQPRAQFEDLRPFDGQAPVTTPVAESVSAPGAGPAVPSSSELGGVPSPSVPSPSSVTPISHGPGEPPPLPF